MLGTYVISDGVPLVVEFSSHVNGLTTQEENAQNPEELEEITRLIDKKSEGDATLQLRLRR